MPGHAASGGWLDPPQEWPAGTFLARLDAPARDALLRLGSRRSYEPREPLLHEGERSGQIAVILSGWVKVSAVAGSGREALLSVRVRGDIVGELAALDAEPRSATVSACGKVVTREIGSAQFHDFLNDWPAATLAVALTVADRLRTATRRRIELSGYNVRDRVIRVLADLSREYGQDTRQGRIIGIELTQPELAAAVGAGEASVHTVLKELRESGLIATGYRRLVVLRPDDLDGMAR
jgi:CRP-like cAMP-binding protein